MKERRIVLEGPFTTITSFDYVSLYPSVIKYHTNSYRMLIVSMNRKKIIKELWTTENKNTKQ